MDDIENIRHLPPKDNIDEKKLNFRTRQDANSFSEAAIIMSYLADFWESWFPGRDFMDDVFERIWNEESIDLEDLNQQLKEIEESQKDAAGEKYTPESKLFDLRLAILHISCTCVVLAFQSEKDTPLSWGYVADASRWYGVLKGSIASTGLVSLYTTSHLGRRGAEKRHQEHKEMKKDIFKWLDKNWTGEKSKDAIAADLAGKEVPVSFRAVRKWITEWDKLRSASKE